MHQWPAPMMLKTSIPFDLEMDNVVHAIKQSVLTSSNIVVVCGRKAIQQMHQWWLSPTGTGAGISLAASIQSFRGEGGMSISKAERDLFHVDSLQVSSTPAWFFVAESNSTWKQNWSQFCCFMAKLTSESLNTAPTKLYQWLAELQREGRLLQVYCLTPGGPSTLWVML